MDLGGSARPDSMPFRSGVAVEVGGYGSTCSIVEVVIRDDVNGGLLGRGAGAVDAHVDRPVVRARIGSVDVGDQQPARPAVPDLVIDEFAVGVGGVAETVAIVGRAGEVTLFSRQQAVQALLGGLLGGRGAPRREGQGPLGGGVALVEVLADLLVVEPFFGGSKLMLSWRKSSVDEPSKEVMVCSAGSKSLLGWVSWPYWAPLVDCWRCSSR